MDTLIGLALDNAAHSKGPILVYVRTPEIPTRIFGRNPVQSPLLEAPELDSAQATRVLQAAPRQRWNGTLSLSREVRWVDDSLFAYWLHSPKGYQEFRRRNPARAVIYAVGSPVVNPAQRVAVVYVESLCGPFCDSGHFYVFTRDGDRWVLRGVALNWVS